jgi:acetyl esterase/lipase
MAELRRRMNETLQPNVKHMRELYPVEVEETTIDGISVAIITPRGGVPARNKNRLMINAPGGGFRTGIRANGLLISIPVAAVGQFKVVSLLYRQGPEHKFPAATEDFTTVYKAMLKHYKAANIGLVGCSAGGTLVAQSVAHFQQAGLPRPGVIGIYCAGAGAKWTEGDSAVFAGLATGASVSMPPGPAYLDSVSVDDPAVTPAVDLKVLAKFPPTLFATGTRDFAMSSAAYGHRRMLKAGVESDLLIYDGLGHGFMTNPDYPEARDLYELAAKFYDRHLGR